MAHRLGESPVARIPFSWYSEKFFWSAKRFRKQIFLSVDLPLTLGQGEQLVFEAEKRIVETLEKIVILL